MKNGFRNWSDVRVFLAVLREGSTLAASRTLGMAQPTVARRIEALEHETGLMLFTRDTRGFHPTEAARILLPAAEAMAAAAGMLAETATALGRVRPIRITAYSGNFSQRVTAIFTDFSLTHPEIVFEFLPDVRVLDLSAGEADIALRLTRSPPAPDLVCRRISTARFALYAARSYAERHGLPASLAELPDHGFVSFRREGVPQAFHDWLLSQVPPDRILRTFSEIDLMHAAIKAGHGLGVMNLRYAEDHPSLIRCLEPIEALTSEHLMLIAPEAWHRPEVKSFTRFFAPRYAAIFR